MFKKLRFQNFKSWKDTGDIELAPITGFFGTNSSGKSTILQFLLMLKQTVESSDQQRVLNTGDDRTYIELGTLYDISYHHNLPNKINFDLEWDFFKKNKESIANRKKLVSILSLPIPIIFSAQIQLEKEDIFVNYFRYTIKDNSQIKSYEMRRKEPEPKIKNELIRKYELITNDPAVERINKKSPLNIRPWLKNPVKSYRFPNEIINRYKNIISVFNYTLSFENSFQKTYYLGPLREYPKRIYTWSGEQPQDVGRRGEFSIPALIASRNLFPINFTKEQRRISLEERIAIWLRELGLIDSFRVEPIAENRQIYEVRVRRSTNSSEVLITDVGFGVSQILPVLVLCYYVPEGSTIILEQPEIHLHPSVQAGLADVFIDAMKTRNVQIILESHSEHLLRRLQRRIAEEKDGLTNQDIKLYFCSSQENGDSQLTPLQIDPYGNIMNWPENFFGDEMGDLFAMTEAAMKRQMENEGT